MTAEFDKTKPKQKQTIKIDAKFLEQKTNIKIKQSRPNRTKSTFINYEALLQLKKYIQHNVKMSKDLNMCFTERVIQMAPCIQKLFIFIMNLEYK